jgi:GPH family glycoside/pentoside/hexuronide:cation symporter
MGKTLDSKQFEISVQLRNFQGLITNKRIHEAKGGRKVDNCREEVLSCKIQMQKADELSFGTRVAYGCGDSACNVVYGMISTLLTLFYTDYVGVSVAAVGIVMLVSRVFDGSSDLLMGIIVGKTHSRWGSCRPWLLWMAIPYAISAIALFTVPQTTAELQFWYIFVTYNLCTTVVYTAINVPYGALSTHMTRSSHERDMLSIYRLVLARCGQIVTVMSTMPLVKLFGNDQMAWVKAITIWSIMAVILLLVCFARCKETVNVEKVRSSVKVPAGKSARALVTNKYFWATLFLWTATCIHTTLIGTILPYYCKYIFGNDTWMYSILFVSEIGTLCIGALFCPMLLRHMGKRDLTLRGCIIVIVTQCLFLLNPDNFYWMVVTSILRAFGEAPLYAVIFGMIGDTVEYGQWKSHIRQESLIFGCGSMGFKIGTGVASALISLLLTIAGYVSSDNGGAIQSLATKSMIMDIYKYGPIIVWGIALFILLSYKLDKIYPIIVNDLRKREEAGQM